MLALLATLVAAPCPADATPAPAGDPPPGFITTDHAPPPGFEHLAGPQTTLVDVWFGGRLRVSTMARYEPGAIEFLVPGEVTGALPRLADAPAVTRALSGPLDANAGRLCRYGGQPSCGVLEPALAGVIFDEARFRVDVFVHPDYLVARPAYRSKFLPESTADFSTVHNVTMSASRGGGLAESGFNVGSTSLFARRSARVASRYDVDADGFAISELSWQRDLPGWRYEAGSFRSYGRSVAFLGEQDVIGIRAGGSLDTRADLDTADATPIFLFLGRRSRVDVRRDGQLLDSRYYDAGNQQLDTSRLPDGAYDIDVLTRDADGRTREQTFFFVRTARLPPLDQPLYYAEAGTLAQTGDSVLPRADGGAWFRAGTARRIGSGFGAEAELVHAGETTLAQGGVFLFGPGWQLEAAMLASSAADSGFSLRGSLRRGHSVASVDVRRVSAADEPANQQAFDPIPQGYTQGSLTLSTPLYDGRFYARAQIDQRGNAGRQTAFGATYTRPLLRRETYTLDLDVDATRDRNESIVRIGVQARWRRDRLTATARPHLVSRFGGADDGTAINVDARATRQDRDTPAGDLTSSVYTASESGRRTLGAGFTSESSFGYANLEVQHTSEAGGGLGVSANAAMSIVTDDGHTAWGGRRSDVAAVVFDIDGEPGTAFDVLVDRQPAGVASVGKRSVVGLRPYDSYEIRLEPRGETFVEFDERPRQVTLYPGNVETLRFATQRVTVIVGQLVDDGGQPVVNGRFDGLGAFAGTDATGWFQVELSGTEPLTVRRRGLPDCSVTLPAFDPSDGLAVLETLVCHAIPALP